jgi:hypothetical protein
VDRQAARIQTGSTGMWPARIANVPTVTGIIGEHCGFSALVHGWGMTVVCRSWIDAGFKKGVLMKKFLLAAIGLGAALSLSACAGKDPVFIGKGKGPPPAAPPIVRKG